MSSSGDDEFVYRVTLWRRYEHGDAAAIKDDGRGGFGDEEIEKAEWFGVGMQCLEVLWFVRLRTAVRRNDDFKLNVHSY